MAPKLPYLLVPATYSTVVSVSVPVPVPVAVSSTLELGGRAAGRADALDAPPPTPNFSLRRLAAADVEYADSATDVLALAAVSRAARSLSLRSLAPFASIAAASSSDCAAAAAVVSIAVRRASAFSFIRLSLRSFSVIGDVVGDGCFLSVGWLVDFEFGATAALSAF